MRVPEALRGWRTRARDLRDRKLLPEATGGEDQWQRVVLNAQVARFLADLGPAGLDAAEISGASHAQRGFRSFRSLDWPDFDLCAPLPEHLAGAFDVVCCEQVLEHVLDPRAAMANLRGLVRPGGHVVVSTPFLIRVHDLPDWGMPDYWRWTPDGLRLDLERAGLDVGEVGAWGNRDVIAGNLDRWPRYRRGLPLRNEDRMPVQVWAFARRPA